MGVCSNTYWADVVFANHKKKPERHHQTHQSRCVSMHQSWAPRAPQIQRFIVISWLILSKSATFTHISYFLIFMFGQTHIMLLLALFSDFTYHIVYSNIPMCSQRCSHSSSILHPRRIPSPRSKHAFLHWSATCAAFPAISAETCPIAGRSCGTWQRFRKKGRHI